jgi:hypothetical protein
VRRAEQSGRVITCATRSYRKSAKVKVEWLGERRERGKMEREGGRGEGGRGRRVYGKRNNINFYRELEAIEREERLRREEEERMLRVFFYFFLFFV